MSKGRSDEERLAIAEEVRREGRETLNEQIETLSWIDEKAGRMMRVNILFLGIILSAFSFLIGQDIVRDDVGIFNLFTIVGLGFTVLSISISALAYTASNTVGGIRGEEIGNIMDSDYSELQVTEGIASSYEDWIKGNKGPVVTNALWITAAAIFLTAGLIYLSLGVIHAVAFSVHWGVGFASVVVLVGYSYYSGLFTHLRGWSKVTHPRDRISNSFGRAKNYLSWGHN